MGGHASPFLETTDGGATWTQIYGVAMLCGIGFTMSLFIGGLAFPDSPELIDEVKIGVLAGSILSAVVGFLVLRFARPWKDDRASDADIARDEAEPGAA